jgi:hypothetical protein
MARNAESPEFPLWAVLEEIVSKRDWYEKVFRTDIVNVWRGELPPKSHTNFELAVRLLRTTAQGVRHKDDCPWESGSSPLCDACLAEYKKELEAEYLKQGETLDELPDDWDRGVEPCEHPRCKCTPPDSTLEAYVEYAPPGAGVLSPVLHAECKAALTELARASPVDWHPGSGERVLDIVHPSLNCYVRGETRHADGSVQSACDESERYQWLPAEFQIGRPPPPATMDEYIDGILGEKEPGCKVTIASRVNNLDTIRFPKMVPLLERTFERFLPALERVLRRPLSGDLQVIVKIGSIILDPTKPDYAGGSWHIEGMPYEHIAATCIHYVDVRGATPSFLEFRKPVIVGEENLDYPQSDGGYTTHHYGITPGDHHEGTMNRYLGLIRCDEGASVVFPNTLQHRVRDFKLLPDSKSSHRMILAFFVIDPDHRIVSTLGVPAAVLPRAVAEKHRERLMYHRKYFVSRLNEAVFERPFSLCEH